MKIKIASIFNALSIAFALISATINLGAILWSEKMTAKTATLLLLIIFISLIFSWICLAGQKLFEKLEREEDELTSW